MKVILFGAGASFGSELEGRVPPLGEQLFDELAKFAPDTWGSLLPPWPERFRDNFEAAMSSFLIKGDFAAPYQWDMADFFYGEFQVTPTSAYVDLIRGLQQHIKGIAFATLNYETLLFQARDFSGVDEKHFSLCLPHGNAALFCDNVSGNRGVTYSGHVATSGRVRYFHDRREFIREKASNVFPPVMSYYEPSKFTVSGANYIERERAKFKALVEKADRVSVIGARVHAPDRHIWEPLATARGTILYVSGVKGAKCFREWAASEKRMGDIVLESHFRESIGRILEFMLKDS
ncbi:hypothetical protein KBZ14_06065 [Synechococcus sp. HJ21-Hayes]|uniref:hypothetical protein n=1 Tax=unclassified Synechococcus TaxID=2626047 RepID=UPI0020CD6062|nr:MULTISPECIES: hypothetical protein [unclassified Synechococcus]MCP9831872.1 hypothetical protein [Synechococcus sp. JJ3a-Johnson]MCP9852435.1 hypothetical protein [Synechococcus sp. HJ21-Hayes]